MGLTHALNIAKTGLHVSQAGLELVARNVANADTVGYTKKTLHSENLIADNVGIGVRLLSASREINTFLQIQLRQEKTALAALDVKEQFLERVDQILGTPGGPNALDTIFNKLKQSFQDLSTSPESFTARAGVVESAQIFAQNLQSLSRGIQSLRQFAEDSLADTVRDVTDALLNLQSINEQLGTFSPGSAPVDILDQRDIFIDRVAQNLDVTVHFDDQGKANIFSRSGETLLENKAISFEFDQRSNISAQSLYSTDPAKRGVGTITLTATNGFTVDLIRNGSLTSGTIGSLVDLRDNLLVEAQAQLDELAHGLALTFSDKNIAGTAATVGLQTGFEIDVTDLLPGNSVTLNYTETATSTPRTITIVRVDDPTLLPLSDDLTATANDTVIGIDFSAGIAAAALAIDTAVGGAITVSNPSGNLLRFLDDGGANTTDIDSVFAQITSTATQDDGLGIPLFVDGGNSPTAYTGNFEGQSQKVGFSERIIVNKQVVSNNELLVRYSTAPKTALGDPDRPSELLDRLTENNFVFSPLTGLGQSNAPFTGTVGSFVREIISFQSGQAARVGREKSSQEVVTKALQDRFTGSVEVNVDEELSDLISLQHSFAASSRVIQAIDEMIDVLLRT